MYMSGDKLRSKFSYAPIWEREVLSGEKRKICPFLSQLISNISENQTLKSIKWGDMEISPSLTSKNAVSLYLPYKLIKEVEIWYVYWVRVLDVPFWIPNFFHQNLGMPQFGRADAEGSSYITYQKINPLSQLQAERYANFPPFWPQKSAVPLLSSLQIGLGSWNLVFTFSEGSRFAFWGYRLFSPNSTPSSPKEVVFWVVFFYFYNFLSLFLA